MIGEGKEEDETEDNGYAHLMKCVFETIQEVVSEKKWMRKNGQDKRALRKKSTRVSTGQANKQQRDGKTGARSSEMQNRLPDLGCRLGGKNRKSGCERRHEGDL